MLSYYNDRNHAIVSPISSWVSCFKTLTMSLSHDMLTSSSCSKNMPRLLEILTFCLEQNWVLSLAQEIGTLPNTLWLDTLDSLHLLHFRKPSISPPVTDIIRLRFNLVTRETFHKTLNQFPSEISAIRLSLLAKETLGNLRMIGLQAL